MIRMKIKQLQRKNSSSKMKWVHLLGLWCLVLLLPASVCAQEEIDYDEDENEGSVYQESYERQINTPYQQETFEQNQYSYGIPYPRRPTFRNFDGAEERAYRSREEMRRDKMFELERELRETDLKQRQLDLQEQQQASSGLQGYGQEEGGPFGGFVPPGPPIIVDNQNNTQVIIQLGQDEEGNPVFKPGGSNGSIKSDVTVIQEGTGNNTQVDIQR